MILSKAKQIVCISNTLEKYKLANPDLFILENQSIAVNQEGRIVEIGDIDHNKYPGFQVFDCSGKSVIPGFVDPHTHSCYAGDRYHEFIMKLEGATYQQIHQMGGGIYHTVNHVHNSTVEQLADIMEKVVRRAVAHGTTTMECKSGYGLVLEHEVKQLQAINMVAKRCPIDIVATYCAAHALPKGVDEWTATKDIVENQIPKIKQLKEEGTINPQFIDVFCEKGIFELECTKRILEAGKAIGLQAAFHGEELNHLESATLGAQLGAISISHLEYLSEQGIQEMAKSKSVGIILPTTHFILKLHNPPVRAMLEAGVPTALGSDFCPNAHCMSMPLVMSLACLNLKMKASEALCGATLNAAAALGKAHEVGSIEVGKLGDFVVLDSPNWEHIIYEIGDSPIQAVIKRGKVIHQRVL